jgi:L-fuculose-phosphate aldolase
MYTDWEIRRNILSYGKRVYEMGFVAATDGNISVRTMNNRLMITPSGVALGKMNSEELIYVDFEGRTLQGRRKPSSELPMHIMIYKQRLDVQAIIHTHPPIATAFSVAGKSLSQPVLPEVVLMFGEIPVASYATPSTIESAYAVKNLILDHDIIILDHHGAVSIGSSLEDAFLKLEKLEQTAKTLIAAKQLGEVLPLSTEEINKLVKIHAGEKKV